MKSIIVKLLISCLLISYSLNLQTSVKKTDTVLEFFNDMFLEGKNGSSPVASGSAPGSASNSSMTNPSLSNSSNTNSTDMIGDWLQISSPMLKNKNKYPNVVLPDGREISIKTDSEFFRINDAFTTGSISPTGPKTEKDFWFRLSGTHLYYSMSQTDINLMGAISIDTINNAEPDAKEGVFCFGIDDDDKNNWKLCAVNEKIRVKWICAIKSNLDLPTTNCEDSSEVLKAEVNLEKTVIEQTTIQPIILIPLPSKKCNANWNYDNLGAEWECGCKDQAQSPIDLPTKEKAVASPVAPLFQYENVQAKSPLTTVDGEIKSSQYIKIKYFANALRIFHPNLGKIVTLDGSVYIAEEIVFHTPSEHTIDGKRLDMEMQIIHYGQSRGDIAKQVVLSFLFKKKAGVYNKFMDDIDFFNLPNPIFKERDITNDLFIPKIFYSSTDESIPTMSPFSFYTYQGSITFPPCTERTIHYVASEPIPIGSVPLQLMKEALKSPDAKDEFGNLLINNDEPANYRQTQPLNGRSVFYYDSEKYCGAKEKTKKKIKPQGHYEKVPKKVTEYYYVNGNEPSGLPGSFLVDEKEAKGELNK